MGVSHDPLMGASPLRMLGSPSKKLIIDSLGAVGDSVDANPRVLNSGPPIALVRVLLLIFFTTFPDVQRSTWIARGRQ